MLNFLWQISLLFCVYWCYNSCKYGKARLSDIHQPKTAIRFKCIIVQEFENLTFTETGHELQICWQCYIICVLININFTFWEINKRLKLDLDGTIHCNALGPWNLPPCCGPCCVYMMWALAKLDHNFHDIWQPPPPPPPPVEEAQQRVAG